MPDENPFKEPFKKVDDKDEEAWNELKNLGAKVFNKMFFNGLVVSVLLVLIATLFPTMFSMSITISFILGFFTCVLVVFGPAFYRVMGEFRLSYLRELKTVIDLANKEILTAKMGAVVKAINEKIDISLLRPGNSMEVDLVHNKVNIKGVEEELVKKVEEKLPAVLSEVEAPKLPVKLPKPKAKRKKK